MPRPATVLLSLPPFVNGAGAVVLPVAADPGGRYDLTFADRKLAAAIAGALLDLATPGWRPAEPPAGPKSARRGASGRQLPPGEAARRIAGLRAYARGEYPTQKALAAALGLDPKIFNEWARRHAAKWELSAPSVDPVLKPGGQIL